MADDRTTGSYIPWCSKIGLIGGVKICKKRKFVHKDVCLQKAKSWSGDLIIPQLSGSLSK